MAPSKPTIIVHHLLGGSWIAPGQLRRDHRHAVLPRLRLYLALGGQWWDYMRYQAEAIAKKVKVSYV